MANGKTLIRGACVLTMGEKLGTIHDGAVLIEKVWLALQRMRCAWE
jgi:hypothetical protein